MRKFKKLAAILCATTMATSYGASVVAANDVTTEDNSIDISSDNNSNEGNIDDNINFHNPNIVGDNNSEIVINNNDISIDSNSLESSHILEDISSFDNSISGSVDSVLETVSLQNSNDNLH